MTDDNTPPRLVRRVEAIEQLGISEATFDRWVRNGTIPRMESDIPGVWVSADTVDRIKASHGRMENR